METTPEDQHSHHGHQDNPNEFRSMRDRMHPPRMSAPSCIVPPTEQLVIRPILFHFYQLSMDGKTNGLKRQISNFSAKENEKFYECWERYMEAINACPHHGFDTWLLEAMDFLSYVAEVQGDGMNQQEKWEMKSQPSAFNAKAGMYTLNEDDDMKAKFAAMTRRLEELELKKMHEVQAVAETPVQEMFGDQANVIGQFKPNNNASVWKYLQLKLEESSKFLMEAKSTQYQQPAQPSQPSQQSSSLEQAIVNLSKIDNLQYSISRLTNLNTVQEKGRFPSQPHQNPKGIHEVETHEGESSQVRDVKALITLRSAFLTEQVSAIIQCKSPLKYKDPGCPTISVMIGGKVVEKALLDLGASVNLLPYSVYKQLGLGELKPTSITLSLADRSQITPEEEEGPEEVCIIDTLVEEHCNQNMQDKLNESLGILKKGCLNPDVLATLQGDFLLEVLKRCKKAIGWQISDLKGISPLVCTHHIYMEEEAKPIRQPQRRLNPHLQEVVRAEVLKLLQAGIIYPYLTALGSGEDHFHMSIWNIAYRRMPFGLCNAPATFQRCMLSIFSDMVERIMEVFMDDITIYGGSFIIVFTDHSALKYLLTKQDAKARLAIAHNSHVLPINDDFPEESLMLLENPWYAHIANYLVTGEVPSEWKAQDRKHFFAKIHAYYWEEPFLFKYCADQIIRKCVPEEEQQGILSHCHENACGGHFASQKTAMKVLQSGFTWPSLFKDSHIM
ncbi:hypothetical protein CK203_004600 [Vitis vinifera]|uniref:Reverse transcriptase n=1 Tax=Vitis vinifera TaxID=29760 RepID=A0A438KG98_VITVI|nr:hypothetical protein CK203_004600 [Vitis vinifera]